MNSPPPLNIVLVEMYISVIDISWNFCLQILMSMNLIFWFTCDGDTRLVGVFILTRGSAATTTTPCNPVLSLVGVFILTRGSAATTTTPCNPFLSLASVFSCQDAALQQQHHVRTHNPVLSLASVFSSREEARQLFFNTAIVMFKNLGCS